MRARVNFGFGFLRICGCVSVLLLLPGIIESASADSIWLIDESNPVFGIVESQSDKEIVFRETEDGKQFRSITLDRDRVKTVVINHDTVRLQGLRPGNALAYFEYAEELVPQKRDPVARDLAIRLFVIAVASSTDARLRHSALNQLVLLARTEKEKTELMSLLYVETGVKPAHQSRSDANPVPSEELRAAAIDLVRSVRQQKPVSTRILDERIKPTVDFYKSICSWDELVLISKSNRIDNSQLRRLVALERRLLADPDELNSLQTQNDSWNTLAKRMIASELAIPRIETVTEFNPRESIYVDGQWIAEEFNRD